MKPEEATELAVVHVKKIWASFFLQNLEGLKKKKNEEAQ
jgi:hypothetical protein